MANIMSEMQYDARMAALRTKFPTQFDCLANRIFCFPGWLPLFEKLCADVDLALNKTDHPECFHCVQVKEKFGTLRAYYRGQSIPVDCQIPARGRIIVFTSADVEKEQPGVWRMIRTLVDQAELASAGKCLWCGARGRLFCVDGWLATQCEEHQNLSWTTFSFSIQ